MLKIALIGAGGKMGTRLSSTLQGAPYELACVETAPEGLARMAARGLTATERDEAVADADFVVLAVPDKAIRRVSADVVPLMRTGATLMLLDPAAAYMNHLPDRDDVAYFVCHPCHPPVFNDETTPEARTDYFGGGFAKQSIVCALMHGPEDRYAAAEAVARAMFAPILRSHRVTVEQMATLEPAMSETVTGTCIMLLRESLDETVKSGVPREAALDFMLGHINVELAIAFLEGYRFSDAALVAIEYGREKIVKPDWKELFQPERIRESVARMLE